MKPLSFMLIAGEASGDLLARDLVAALRTRIAERQSQPTDDVQPLRTNLAPHFFGAGGPRMAAAGVQLAFDLTKHSVIGVSDVLKHLLQFRRMFRQLLALAIERQPDVIIGVDYGGFNLRLGRAIKNHVRRHCSEFVPWNPKLVQFVSPQVWASRPGRARVLERNYDLLLSIFPFERDWYAAHAPKLRVEFVGHPMLGRMGSGGTCSTASPPDAARERVVDAMPPGPNIVLLPGSRADEVRRHLPVVIGAFELLRREMPDLRGRMVLSDEALARLVRSPGVPVGVEVLVGGLSDALAVADLAITKSGTITMECAAAGVPAVVFYKTSWPTYVIGKQVVSVPYLAMPNLLAGKEIFPEFVQHRATPENISRAVLGLLRDEPRRAVVKATLRRIIASLGGPGATTRAADAILSLLP